MMSEIWAWLNDKGVLLLAVALILSTAFYQLGSGNQLVRSGLTQNREELSRQAEEIRQLRTDFAASKARGDMLYSEVASLKIKQGNDRAAIDVLEKHHEP